MTLQIILTDAQANLVRGRLDVFHTLAPRKLFGIGWALPATVLTDPVYARFVSILQPLTQVDITSADANWQVSFIWYSSSWPIGQLITV